MRRSRGFTLIEVLLATVLLVAGLALAFSTLGAATRTATRGEAMAERSERMRTIENFLRTRLNAMRPVGFALDQSRGVTMRFAGEPERMRFVADLPDYLGRGGPYLHELVIEDDRSGGVRLTLGLAMVLAGEVVEEQPPRPPEVLADGLREVRFRYRTLDEDGRMGDWQDRWEAHEQLPLQVQILLVDRDGRVWPPLVVAPPLAPTFTAFNLPVQTQ
ncbi:prepilin-type N-terminal cleavage/methylation domain-containing protein [Lysobacter sp.]|uniref:prepilin-type N-terminal cleavage/methylation domain-containing protein n=1 Tax=Lysobacter sp. TaxID=72226 RepID=UPI002D4691CD|nr:prepilin-type N-terminal cleavage/methylation domain-containing protein [Lysobacter sp.]HZX79171.1 prepilin-type N-terminal cleavage/methylation domain-containing protein [Lysobacter sp.]